MERQYWIKSTHPQGLTLWRVKKRPEWPHASLWRQDDIANRETFTFDQAVVEIERACTAIASPERTFHMEDVIQCQ